MNLYDKFMRDHVIEANQEMYKYLGQEYIAEEDDIEDDIIDEEDLDKEPNTKEKFKKNFYFQKNLVDPIINPILTKQSGQDHIIQFTGNFIDDHYTQLSEPGPIYSFTFGAKQVNDLYQLFGINGDQLFEMYQNMVNETFYGTISKFITGWIKHAPHKILLVGMLVWAIQNNNEDIRTCCEYLLAFTEYPILYRDYWKTGVKEDVMRYTLEHLGKKNIVNRVKNLKELLKYDANKAVECKLAALKEGADNSYTDFLRRLRNGINSKLKNISRAYYPYNDQQATQHNNVSVFDDGELADQEGQTTNIAQIVDKTLGKFSLKDINHSMVDIAANNAEVDKGLLASFISQIYNTKNSKVGKLVENVITAFFVKNPTENTVNSSTFLVFGLALYRSIGTSKDPLYSEIKDILAYWMNDIIDIRSQYKREATIIAYTKAIFNYIILMIKYYN